MAASASAPVKSIVLPDSIRLAWLRVMQMSEVCLCLCHIVCGSWAWLASHFEPLHYVKVGLGRGRGLGRCLACIKSTGSNQSQANCKVPRPRSVSNLLATGTASSIQNSQFKIQDPGMQCRVVLARIECFSPRNGAAG